LRAATSGRHGTGRSAGLNVLDTITPENPVLVQHAGKVLTHKFLLGELWDDLTDAQYLRVYVRQLRQKIEADPERPQYILTETGVGYRLRAPD
jgi:DNA-binding response OmpR family regulator